METMREIFDYAGQVWHIDELVVKNDFHIYQFSGVTPYYVTEFLTYGVY